MGNEVNTNENGSTSVLAQCTKLSVVPCEGSHIAAG